MTATGMATGNSIARAGNIAALVAAIAIILILPFKKEIWYDETVSIQCSKGISHTSHLLFAQDSVLSSSAIQALNTDDNVFKATVADNGNSFLYNIALHWFMQITDNSLNAYMLLSRLCAVGVLLAFFVLCRLFLPNGHFISLAIILLGTDTGFMAMSHEIRAYSMGIMFVTLAAVYAFKYALYECKTVYLFFAALFSVAAILTHYLCLYMVLFFIGILLLYRWRALMTARSIIVIGIPVLLLGMYLYLAYAGLKTMGLQNQEIQKKFAGDQFSISEVIFRGMKIMAVNFKIVYPAFKGNKAVFTISCLVVLLLYAAGLKMAHSKTERRNVHLLFIAGMCSTIFLVLLSLKSHHYTSLYFRYYSFGLPFDTLFVVYVLYLMWTRTGVSVFIKSAVVAAIVVPAITLSIITIKDEHPHVQYNHAAVASEIIAGNIHKIDVPSWRDAFLIQSLLPQTFKIDYFRNAALPEFTLYTDGGTQKIPVTREDQE